MELVLFIVGGWIVLLYLARKRFGKGADSATRRAREGEPIGYGSAVSPPGTSRAASVSAGWFGRRHDGDSRGRGGH
jgi:hypothetical protein